MIIDLDRFIDERRPQWDELESILDRFDDDPFVRLDLKQAKRFHYLYQRTAADLAQLMTFSGEWDLRQFLETLVARSYGHMHEIRRREDAFQVRRWFLRTLPQTFRRHRQAFYLSLIITLVGAAIGGGMVAFDSQVKRVLIPFPHLSGDPSERVANEEQSVEDPLQGRQASFSSYLMTHNIKVSILTLAMGVTYGFVTIILLFYNGIILGAVSLDYILAGQSVFLAGWLLPHGAVEIPSIIIAGQGGFILARAMIGWQDRQPMRQRLRMVLPDLVTLIGGLTILLVWAGIVEAFFSQYHEPILPYGVKIGFGVLEMLLLFFFLFRTGVKVEEDDHDR